MVDAVYVPYNCILVSVKYSDMAMMAKYKIKQEIKSSITTLISAGIVDTYAI